MEIIKNIKLMHQISRKLSEEKKSVAFVPTMGYLHKGHISLMEKAKELADYVVCSSFVNPTQFGPNDDFDKYPRDLDKDIQIAESSGVDYFFFPEIKDMYDKDHQTVVVLDQLTKNFEGAKRPGHFDGVSTIVTKLFNIVKPDYAIFGQKDIQQAFVIKQLVADLNFDIKIHIAPTIREKDGLALSSRNIYLNPSQREQATIIYKALKNTEDLIRNGLLIRNEINQSLNENLLRIEDIKIDYACAVRYGTFEEPEIFDSNETVVLIVACFMGSTRLIDNFMIHPQY